MVINSITADEISNTEDIVRYSAPSQNVLEIACKWVIKSLRNLTYNDSLSQKDVGTAWTSNQFIVDEDKVKFSLSFEINSTINNNIFFDLRLIRDSKNIANYTWTGYILSKNNEKRWFHEFKDRSLRLNNIKHKFKEYILPDNSIKLIIYITATKVESLLPSLPKSLSKTDEPNMTSNDPEEVREITETVLQSTEESMDMVNGKDKEDEIKIDELFWQEQMRKMEKLLYDQSSSDVTLKFPDGRKLHAHKIMLSMRSRGFYALYGTSPVSKLEIDDISYEAMQIILKFLYTGHIDSVNLDNAPDILRAADKYQIEGLSNKCQKLLREQVSVDNAVEALIISDLYNACTLKNIAVDVIVSNLKSFNQSQFQKLADVNADLLVAILAKNAKIGESDCT